MSLTLRVEFSGGTPIEEAAAEMCALATRLSVTVGGKFNDVSLLAFPNGDPVVLAANWWAETRDKSGLPKVASTVDRRHAG